MFAVTARTLNILAALVWLAGGVALLLKGLNLLVEAQHLRPQEWWPWLAGAAGAVFGALKARLFFSKSCRKNIERIAALKSPKVWQFYRARFFAVLAVVIIASAWVTRLAHGNYPLLVFMGALDLSVSIALLGSSPVYIKEKAFGR